MKTDTTPQRRLYRLCLALVVLLSLGAGYALWIQLTHLAIPCPVHWATGLLCPGCGITRMCMALLRLDFGAAWNLNPVLLVLLPILGGLLVYRAVMYVKHGRVPTQRWESLAWGAMGVVLVLWGVIRNII